MPPQPEGLCGRGRWGLCLAEEETQTQWQFVPVTPQWHSKDTNGDWTLQSPAWCHQTHPGGSWCSSEVPVVLLNPLEMWKAAPTSSSMGAPCSRSAGECQSSRRIHRADYTTSCVICTAGIMHFAETSGFPIKWLIALWWTSQLHSAPGSTELSLGTEHGTAASQLLLRDGRNSLIPPPSNPSHSVYSNCSSLSCPGVPDLNEQHFVQNLSSKFFRFLRIWKQCLSNELIILNKRNKWFLLLLPLLKASLCAGQWENCLHQQLLNYFLFESLDMQIHIQSWSHRITN